jgi:hypothetical protein
MVAYNNINSKYKNKNNNMKTKTTKKIMKNLKLNPYFVSGFTDASKKSIVVFGTNLTSTVGIKFTRTQLTIIKLAPYQKSVIIGLILSDGWLTIASKTSKNARLGFAQSVDHSKYF